MNFLDALSLAESGKTIRRRAWSVDPRSDDFHFDLLLYDGILVNDAHVYEPPHLRPADFRATDWRAKKNSEVRMNKDKLIDDFASGIEEGQYVTVMAIGKRFVLFRISGHSAWARVGERQYVPVQFVLIRKGQWWMGRDTEKKEWHGRVTRSVLMAAFEQAERTGKLEGA